MSIGLLWAVVAKSSLRRLRFHKNTSTAMAATMARRPAATPMPIPTLVPVLIPLEVAEVEAVGLVEVADGYTLGPVWLAVCEPEAVGA